MAYFITERNTKRAEGKEHIYLTGHPSDIQLLKEMTEEIVRLHDGRVYMAEQMQRCADGAQWSDLFAADEWEDHLEVLQQMNLIVMVVTGRFLKEPHFALKEMIYAKEKHIPILPILMEKNLEEAFNNVCGAYHLINRNTVNYEVKVKEYFEEIFGDDDLTDIARGLSEQQIFSGQIFLSYRKKDRREALDLMKRIHNIECCRDLAIWFDDYLLPGENYNEEIAENLKASGLVILNVTPNLFEPNYIQRVEYPFALSEEKTVLPIVTAGRWTEQCGNHIGEDGEIIWSLKELSGIYPGLEKVFWIERWESFEEALVERLVGLGVRAKTYTPEKMYWLGEAYMRGYRVELDRERGIELMTQAAEAGLIKAMYRLAMYYKIGKGVPRDLDKARLWLERNIEKLREGMRNEAPGGVYSRALANSLASLSDICEGLNDVAGMQKALTDFGEILKCNERAGYIGGVNNRGSFYLRQGIAAQDAGNYELAENYYVKAEGFLRELYEQIGTAGTARNYTLLLKKRAEVAIYTWNTERNAEALLRGIALLENAVKLQKWLVEVGGETYDAENYIVFLRSLAYVYNRRAPLQVDVQAGAVDVNKARDILIELLMREDLSQNTRDEVEWEYAATTMAAGVVMEAVSVECAETLHREAYLAYSNLCKKQEKEEYYFGLAGACINLAVFNQNPPNLELLQQALRIYNMLYLNCPENQEYRAYLDATLKRVKAWPETLG